MSPAYMHGVEDLPSLIVHSNSHSVLFPSAPSAVIVIFIVLLGSSLQKVGATSPLVSCLALMLHLMPVLHHDCKALYWCSGTMCL